LLYFATEDGFMATKKGKMPVGPVIYTANRLDDGRVVFLDSHLQWVDRMDQAVVCRDQTIESGLAAAQESERRQEVVGVYAVDIGSESGPIRPLKQRERIRAVGPSIVETNAPKVTP
jgi:hypothetical protein